MGGRGVETAKVLTIVHKYKFKFSNFVQIEFHADILCPRYTWQFLHAGRKRVKAFDQGIKNDKGFQCPVD